MKKKLYLDGNENRNIFESQWKQKYIWKPMKTEIYFIANKKQKYI